MRLNTTPCRKAAEKALEKPGYCFPAVANGFHFLIGWLPEKPGSDKRRFRATMSHMREKPDSKLIQADDKETLLKSVSAEIQNALKTFPEGGNFNQPARK